jgi:hypothetical protein
MRGLASALTLALLVSSAVAAQPPSAPTTPATTAPATKPATTAPATTPATTTPAATSSGGPATGPASTAAADASKAPALKVLSVSLPPKEATTATTPSEVKNEAARQAAVVARLGQSIVLTTSPELGDYLDYAVKQKKPVTLFLNGNDTGIAPEALDRKAATLRFQLERNGDNKKVWEPLLRDPFHNQTRPVEASVGLAGGAAVPAESEATFTLKVVNWALNAYAWLALLIILLVAFGWLVVNRNILRDGPKPHPYSLGRAQMAWWFFLIIISYVLIWLISGDQETITQSLLALMGISAGTALGAVLIDTTGGSAALSQAATDRLALQAAQQNAQQTVTMAQAAVTAAPADPVAQKNLADAQAALAVVNAKLVAVNNLLNNVAKPPTTRGFLRDILSDSEGTAGLHRFQIVVWTVVLGIIFIVSVLTKLSMPEFSATLLATMGISAGTYLGFKFPEK